MNVSRPVVFLGFVTLCLGTGFLGSLATASSVRTWYQMLVKPSWNPPAWLFGPVWTTLYFFMAYAAYRVYRSGTGLTSPVFFPFWCQLVLNLAWSWIFFYFRQPGWAFADLLLLLGFISWNLVAFLGRDRLAGLLLVPYLAWSTFAAFLNLVIWRLNG